MEQSGNNNERTEIKFHSVARDYVMDAAPNNESH